MLKLSIEELRLSYRPDTIRVLFVGESPPAGGTFFYLANSKLFKYTQKAFASVYGEECGQGTNFLQFFKSIGCYLDDLCLEPINRLDKPTRRRKHAAAVPSLAERIRSTAPCAVIVVMKAISENVQDAISAAQIGPLPTHSLPFPAQGWQRRYVKDLVPILRELRRTRILI
jgi:hypothetical protein